MAIPLPTSVTANATLDLSGTTCVCCSKDSNIHKEETTNDNRVIFDPERQNWSAEPQPNLITRLFGCCCGRDVAEENGVAWDFFEQALKANTGVSLDEACGLTDLDSRVILERRKEGKRLKPEDYEKITRMAQGLFARRSEPSSSVDTPAVVLKPFERAAAPAESSMKRSNSYDELRIRMVHVSKSDGRSEKFCPDKLKQSIREGSPTGSREDQIEELVRQVLQEVDAKSQGKTPTISSEEIRAIVNEKLGKH